jgi:hypothetical protein
LPNAAGLKIDRLIRGSKEFSKPTGVVHQLHWQQQTINISNRLKVYEFK